VAAGGHIAYEVHGAWRKPFSVPSGYTVDSVSCSTTNYCSAAAYYTVSSVSQQVSAVAVSDESAGGWGPWNLLPGTVTTGDAAVSDVISAISCGAPGNCALYGYLENALTAFGQFAAGKQSVPVTSIALALSTAKITVGKEQAERVSVTVLGSAGTPAGSVTVMAGPATLCTVALSGGQGGCTLSAKALTAGSYKVAAYYGINAGFAASHSGTVTLTVTK
jgi:hypothetical protein